MLKTTTPNAPRKSSPGPSESTIQRLLNYSKNIKTVTTKNGDTILMNPN